MMLAPVAQTVSINEEKNNLNWFAKFLIGFFSFSELASVIRFKLDHRTKERATRPIHTYVIPDDQGITALLKLHLSFLYRIHDYKLFYNRLFCAIYFIKI
jgi:hypothetical protein